MPNAMELQVKFGADTTEFDRAEKHVSGIGSRIGGAFAVATGNVLSTGFNKLLGGFSAGLSGALDFGKGMANVNSILKLSDAQLAVVSDQVLDLTNNPGIRDMPATLAAGLYNINSSGFAGAEGMIILENSAIAASAGLTTTDVAARAVTAVLNAYGLQAEDSAHISDLLFQTVNDGVISFDELANNLGNTIPMANALGVSLENLFGAYSQLTLQGILPSAAETDIAALMKTALAPTEALTAAVQEQGFATADQALATLDLAGYTKLITDYSDKYGISLMDLLGTQEAVNAALGLGGANAGAYADEIDNMNHASDGAGATQEALNEQMKSASFQLDKLKQQAMKFATVLVGFVSPSIAKFAGKGASAIGKLTGWVQDFADDFSTIKKSLQNPLGQNFGFNLGEDTKKMGKMRLTTQALGIQIKRLTGIDMTNWLNRMGKSILRPIDASKKLLGAVTDRDWNRAFEGLGDLISSGPKAIGDFFKGIETGIKPVDKLLHTFGKSWTDVGRAIQEVGQQDWDGLQVVLERLGGHLLQLGEQLGGIAFDTLKFTVNAAISVLPVLAEILWGGAKDLYGWIKGKVLGTSQGGPSADASYSGAAGYHTSTAAQSGNIIDVGKAFLSFGVELAGDIWGGAKDLYGWIKDQITGHGGNGDPNSGSPGQVRANSQTIPVGTVFVTAAIDAAGDLLGWLNRHRDEVAGWLKNGLLTAIDVGSMLIGAAVGAATEGAGKLWGWLSENAGTIAGWLKYGLTEAIDVGTMLISAVVNGATDGLNALWGWAKNHEDDIARWLGDGWDFTVKLAQDVIAEGQVTFKRIGEITFGQVDADEARGAGYNVGEKLGYALRAGVVAGLELVFGPDGDGTGTAGTGNGKDTPDNIIVNYFKGMGQGLWEGTGLSAEWDGMIAGFETLGEASINGLLGGMSHAWGGVQNWVYEKTTWLIGYLNRLISAYNRLPGTPDIPEIPWPEIPDTYPRDTPGGGHVADSGSQTGGANGNRVGIIDERPGSAGSVLSREMARTIAEAARLAAQTNPQQTIMPQPGEPGYNPNQPTPLGTDPNGGNDGAGKDGQPRFARSKGLLLKPYADLSKNAISALDPLRTNVPKVFADVGVGVDRSTMTMSRDTVKSFTGMGTDVIAQMTTMQGGSLAAADLMSSGVISGAGLMQTGATGAAGQMNTGVVGQANSMSSGAVLAAMQMAMGMYRVVGAIPTLLSTIDLRGSGYAIGASLGEGLVAGINSQIAAVNAAAAGLAAAAAQRTQKELGVSSPSRVFMWIGEQVGEGFVDGIEASYAATAAAGRGLGNAAIQPMPNPAWNRGAAQGGDTFVTNYYITPDSEQFSEIARQARRGGTLAKDLSALAPNLARQ